MNIQGHKNTFINKTYTFFAFNFLKMFVTSFGRRATFRYSAVHPPILTPPGHWAILRNQCLGLPEETFTLPFCVQPTYDAQEYQTCTGTALSGYQFTHWSNGASGIRCLCPKVCQDRSRTIDTSICKSRNFQAKSTLT